MSAGSIRPVAGERVLFFENDAPIGGGAPGERDAGKPIVELAARIRAAEEVADKLQLYAVADDLRHLANDVEKAAQADGAWSGVGHVQSALTRRIRQRARSDAKDEMARLRRSRTHIALLAPLRELPGSARNAAEEMRAVVREASEHVAAGSRERALYWTLASFGLAGQPVATLTAIAAYAGVSTERVRQVRNRVLTLASVLVRELELTHLRAVREAVDAHRVPLSLGGVAIEDALRFLDAVQPR